MQQRLRRAAAAAALLIPLLTAGPVIAGTPAAGAAAPDAGTGTHHLTLADGAEVRWSDDGSGTVTDKRGRVKAFPVPKSPGSSGLGAKLSPPETAVRARALAARQPAYAVGAGATSARTSQARIQTMNTGPVPLPPSVAAGFKRTKAAPDALAGGSGVPGNAGVSTSLQSYLNAQGVNAIGTFQDAATYLHALPGEGQIITNVSIGDLTDQSMADAGDSYVSGYGPTTVVRNGQRYLDIPSMPLIPTFTADNDARLDPTGSTEGQDPSLGEVLLDFSMMAPLPHDKQRPEAPGNGVTDLLGIAPGADYRLVIPEEPSFEGINAALRAAAHQKPRPNVITASLGFGTDTNLGFPSRWLEDDPTIRATLDSIVKSGIAVVVSSNDGTRLALPVSVGPDGGSTPTEVTKNAGSQTDIDDLIPTTTPSVVKDTGVIAAGGTTTDDTLSSPDVRESVYPTTRYNGSAGYSSGFGSRVDLAAPGDNLPSMMHVCSSDCTAQDVSVVLSGGTSASAPMIAAAMANVLQAAEATHQTLTPRQVRDVLVSTGRKVAQPPQAARPLSVGPQLDVTAAYEKVLSRRFDLTPSAVRLSVAQRQLVPTGAGTGFVEQTDPSHIDLAGPQTPSGDSGQNAVSPITFGLDMTGSTDDLTYQLTVGAKGVIAAKGPSVRLLPAELLKAAGLPLVSSESRTVHVTFKALRHGKTVSALSRDLTFTATDGTYAQAQPPSAPGLTSLGKPVTVSYDLTGVRDLDHPELVLSSVGHYTPAAAVDRFRAQWKTPLTALKGKVTIPASAFTAGGAGLYGVGVKQAGDTSTLGVYGDFRALVIGSADDRRPPAPLVSGPGGTPSHAVSLTRAAPGLKLSWDVSSVPGADGAVVELLSPAPTLFGSINTTTNQNGSGRDDNGGDHASTLFRNLPSAKGRTVLDLDALEVPSSLQYPIRVLATRHGKPVGQASPTSFVEYLDGDQLTGTVEGFTVSGDKALISTDEFDPGLGLKLSQTTPYSLGSGTLGTPMAQSRTGESMQLVVGSDPATGHVMLLHTPYAAGVSARIDVRDGTTGAEVAVTDLTSLPDGAGYLIGGAVDPTRHRGAFTTYDPTTGLDRLWPVDMATGQVGTPLVVNPDNPGRSFTNISFDASSGQVFVATTGTMGACASGRVPYWAVRADLAAGSVTPVTTLPNCTGGLLPDGKGDRLYVLSGAAQPDPHGGEFPVGSWSSRDQDTLVDSPGASLDIRGPMWPALDSTHQVAVVAGLYEKGMDTDNNAMSEITVLDPGTGKVLARHPIANLGASTVAGPNFDFTNREGLFLDPATRTGWVVNAWGTGLQRFHY